MTDYYLLGKCLSTGPSSFQTTSKSNSTTLESQRVNACKLTAATQMY